MRSFGWDEWLIILRTCKYLLGNETDAHTQQWTEYIKLKKKIIKFHFELYLTNDNKWQTSLE